MLVTDQGDNRVRELDDVETLAAYIVLVDEEGLGVVVLVAILLSLSFLRGGGPGDAIDADKPPPILSGDRKRFSEPSVSSTSYWILPCTTGAMNGYLKDRSTGGDPCWVAGHGRAPRDVLERRGTGARGPIVPWSPPWEQQRPRRRLRRGTDAVGAVHSGKYIVVVVVHLRSLDAGEDLTRVWQVRTMALLAVPPSAARRMSTDPT